MIHMNINFEEEREALIMEQRSIARVSNDKEAYPVNITAIL